ncbi:hypothetical protein A3Q56_00168 [Intoshia linei]|uniref:GPI inositol-deacylase n=1 Tax=Intoshia linei TaxID=1819745 RepID=A0A177BCK6_9BILA|nr:hypothetical protein A3Q56_00168 [Intoshia linei]
MKNIFNNEVIKKNKGLTASYEISKITAKVSRIFDDIVNYFYENNYSNGKNIHAAPYDYRNIPEKTFKYKGNLKVVLICHSFGGLVANSFLNKKSQKWKDKYIQVMISLSVPWAGTVKVYSGLLLGNTYFINPYTRKSQI